MPHMERPNMGYTAYYDKIMFTASGGTGTLQDAVNQAIAQKKPLWIEAGTFLVPNLTINGPVHIKATNGQVLLRSSSTSSLAVTVKAATSGARIADVVLEGISFDGENKAFAGGLARPALVMGTDLDRVTIVDCQFWRSDKSGIDLLRSAGRLESNDFWDCRVSISSEDGVGLVIERNYLRESKDNGIYVTRSSQGFDGTIVHGNKVYTVNNSSGGSGQFGNGVVAYLANNAIVSNNEIINCAYSAVRANASSNVVIEANQLMSSRECAIFVEAPNDSLPGFEGAVVATNTIFDAGEGIKVVNPNPGSRGASVSNNVIKNVVTKTFDEWVSATRNPADRYTRVTNACGIMCAADTVVSGNAIEGCSVAAIVADIRGSWNSSSGTTPDRKTIVALVTGNIAKACAIGIGYNTDDVRGFAEIAENVIVGATDAAITGVQATNLSGVPGIPSNAYGPYARVAGSPDIGSATTPISDRFSFARNKVVPATA